MKKLLGILLLVGASFAQAWQPTRPITVVVPNGPGAGNEIAFRQLAKQVELATRASFVFEYKPGAFDTVAMNHFASLPNDGYHVAIPSCQSTYVASDIWYANSIKFNPMEFVPVTNMGKSPLAFYVKLNSDVDTPEKLIAEIRAGRRAINIGVGGAAHKLAVEYLVNGVKPSRDTVETIMYKGPAQVMQDVMAGVVEFGVFPIAVGAPMVQAGKLRVIGIAGEQVLPGLEKYKLMKDYVPGLNVYACWNLILPKNTTSDIVDWYNKHFVAAITHKETQEFYARQFIFTAPDERTPAGVLNSMHRLRQQWQPFVRKIKPE